MKLNKIGKRYIFLGVGIFLAVIAVLAVRANIKPKLNSVSEELKSAAFTYRIIAQQEGDGCHLDRLDIYSEGKRFQDIKLNGIVQCFEGNKNQYAIIEDVNFDNYEDIRIKKDNGGAYNAPSYRYFLYDGQSKRFKPSDDLDALNMSGPSFNKALGTFEYTHKTAGYCGYIKQKFSWREGKPEMISEEEEICDLEKGARTSIIRGFDVNGKFTELSRQERELKQ